MEDVDLLERYFQFVDGVTSQPSKDNRTFILRLQDLMNQGANIARLDTAADGLAGEAGEIKDLIKKIKFHGKPWNDENHAKLVDEASDILWYWATLCMALGVKPKDVILHNIKKLETRYPGGKFDVERSENRLV